MRNMIYTSNQSYNKIELTDKANFEIFFGNFGEIKFPKILSVIFLREIFRNFFWRAMIGIGFLSVPG